MYHAAVSALAPQIYDGQPYCRNCTSFTLPDADRAEYEAFAATPDGQLEYVRWLIAVLREAEAELESGADR